MYNDIENLELFDKLKTKVLKYVLYKKRTEKEVRQKFSSSDVNQNMLEDVIENLKENGYISDEKYIERAINEFMALKNLSIFELYSLFSNSSLFLASLKVTILLEILERE